MNNTWVREHGLPWLVQLWLFALFVLHFLAIKLGALPRWSYGLVDVLSAIVLCVLLVCWRDWLGRVPRAWLWLLGGGVLLAIAGCVVNSVEPWIAFNGLRRYFRFMPFALLPWYWGAVHAGWRRQAGLLLVLLLLQVPLALQQRLAVDFTMAPGDNVIGTLGSPAFLTISMLCAISILAALWLHSAKPRPVWIFGLMSVLFLPCTLNESKSVLLLLPLAVLVPWVISAWRVPIRRGLVLLAWLLCALTVFFPVYDHFNYPRWGYTLWDFMFKRDRIGGYLSADWEAPKEIVVMPPKTWNADPQCNEQCQKIRMQELEQETLAMRELVRQARRKAVLGVKKPGKVDAMRLAAEGVGHFPLHGLLGVGAGNASLSRLQFGDGRLGTRLDHQKPDSTAISMMVWELGFLGIAWLALLGGYLLWHAVRLSRQTGQQAMIGAAAVGVLSLIVLGLLYKNLMNSGVIWGLLWYLSGWLVLLAHPAKTAGEGETV